jgi:hypothetical protein
MIDIIKEILEKRGCDKIEEGDGLLVTCRHRCQYYSVLLQPIQNDVKFMIRNLEIGKSCEYVVKTVKKENLQLEFQSELFKFLDPIKAKTLLWVATVFLGLHQRAAITANHPQRKMERHEFECTKGCLWDP